MKPKVARALLVMAVFAVLAVVSATGSYLADDGSAPTPRSGYKPLGLIFWKSFQYYFAWALVSPGVFWLSRRFTVTRRRWKQPLLFHLLVPVAAAIPFFALQFAVASALAWRVPPFAAVLASWWRILTMESVHIAPTYWLLIALGHGITFFRESEAEQLQAIELQRSLSAAQLDALRMKLQPHFLFNTLNTIGALAQEGETDDVGVMVEHLGTMLRLSMETSGRQFVTLADELRLLDAYVAIEEVRFKDRLVIVRTIAPDVTPAMIPNLILQPLVENAIVHGLARRIDATTIEIAARKNGHLLELSVRDDGPGLSPGWTLGEHAGHGLRNVMDRLAALYGEDGHVQVEAVAPGGTVAKVVLPLTIEPPDAVGRGTDGSREYGHR